MPSAVPTSPTGVRVAAALVALQGLGVVVLAVVVLISGLGHHAAEGQLLSQVAYFVIIGVALAGLGLALWLGKKWARTPVIVGQVVLLAVGYWMAVPSGRPSWGFLLIAAALVTGGLLLLPASAAWADRYGRAVPVAEPQDVARVAPAPPVKRRPKPKNGRRPGAARRR